MDKEKLLKLIEEGNPDIQVPLKFQMPLLGLDDETIKSLKGKTGLDIACGNGSLVEELGARGVLFEGIDPESPDKPYFIVQKITSVSPFMGSIPRDDNSYDIVTVFQCSDLNRGFTLGGEIRTAFETSQNGGQDDWHTIRYKHAQSTLYEIVRVVKPRGRVVVYPALSKLEEKIGPLLRIQGISFGTEPVDEKLAKEYLTSEHPFPEMITDNYLREFGLFERTVLVKNK